MSSDPVDNSSHNAGGAGCSDHGETADMSATEEVFECPICLEKQDGTKHIVQCIHGHIICETCFGKRYGAFRRCETCKADMPFIDIRNKAWEQIAKVANKLELLKESEPNSQFMGIKRSGDELDNASAQKKQKLDSITHQGIYCDNSSCPNNEKSMEGVRYKCMQCGFDCCESCQKAGIHNHHLLVRIRSPRTELFADRVSTLWRESKEKTAACGSAASTGDETEIGSQRTHVPETAPATSAAAAAASTVAEDAGEKQG